MKRIGLLLAMGFCLAFALPTLLLIDATGLWSDELVRAGATGAPEGAALGRRSGYEPP